MSRRLEIGALLALCFFLPLFEAPKNIFWALYLVVWIVNRARARDFGGRWDTWDSLIAAWIGSGFVVAVFAGAPGGDEWRGAIDLLRYGSVLWLTKRSRYSPREITWALAALVASTVVGLAMACVALWRGQEGGLQLNSVGHVNHTAIYLAIVLGLCVSWLFGAWSQMSLGGRALGVAVNALILVALVATASRGAIGVGLAVPVLLAIGWWKRSRVPLLASAVVLAVTAIAMFVGDAQVLRKQEKSLVTNNMLAYRAEIWSMATTAWREHPWFGVGMDNFGRVTPYRKRLAEGKAAPTRDPTRALEFAHAHSLFFNTLAERGLVGSVALWALFTALLISLLRHHPLASADSEVWLLWSAAATAWLVTVGVGMVNTTLHHEHGILASLLLGLWLSRSPKR
jgi:O-antigen ligase